MFATKTLRWHLFCYSPIDVRAVLVVAVRHCNTQLLSESPGVRAIPVGIPFCTSGNVDSKGQASTQGGHGDSRRRSAGRGVQILRTPRRHRRDETN